MNILLQGLFSPFTHYINPDHEFALLSFLDLRYSSPWTRVHLAVTPTPYLAYTKPLSHGPWIPWQEACYEESFIINIRWIPDVILHLTDEDPELLSIQVAISFGYWAFDFLAAPPEGSCSRLAGILIPCSPVSASLPFLVIHVVKVSTCLVSQSA